MNLSPSEPHAALHAEMACYEAADAIEEGHRLGILRVLTAGPDSMTRGHFAPGHITASAFVIHPPSDRLLLHRHRRLGRWLQMGGHLEQNETAPQAAFREATEESGLRSLRFFRELPLDVDIHPIPPGRGEPAHEHFDVRYLMATDDADSIHADPAESTDLRWFSFSEAVTIMSEEGATRVIGKIRRILNG